MTEKHTTLGDLRDALEDYDDDTRIKLNADGVELPSVSIIEDGDAIIFY